MSARNLSTTLRHFFFFAKAPPNEKTTLFLPFLIHEIHGFTAVSWLGEAPFLFCMFLCLDSFVVGFASFILVPVKRTLGSLDSGIAVHSNAGIQRWIS